MKKLFGYLKKNYLLVAVCLLVSSFALASDKGVASLVTFAEVAMLIPRRNLDAAAGRNAGNLLASPSNIMIQQKDIQLPDAASLQSANVSSALDTITVQVASLVGAGATANTVVSLWNPGAGNVVTTNGSGALTITYAWDDGPFNGYINNQQVTTARQGMGAICFRVDFELFVDGLSDPANMAIIRPSFLTYNNFGLGLPVSMNTAARHTRQDFDKGVINMYCIQNISPLTQLTFTMPASVGAVTSNIVNVTHYFNRQNAGI